MVDPRIYRACWSLVAVALILFGFSLRTEPAAITTQSAVGNFFNSVGASARQLATGFPSRRAGSTGDQALAARLSTELQAAGGFSVSSESFTANAGDGTRTLTDVVALRPGVQAQQVVVIAARDSTAYGNAGGLASSAVLVDLARALAGQTLTRGVTLISTSGQVGVAGATHLATQLAGEPVTAVIVLGDLAGGTVRQPVVVPFSSSTAVAPLALTKTVAAYVTQQTGIGNREPAFGAQLLRLAFPVQLTAQAPFAGYSIPAVLLSLAGDRPTTGAAGVLNDDVAAELGTAVAQSVEALDQGASIAAPAPALTLSQHVVPFWAFRVLVLALLAPVALATIDAVARLRRHGHSLRRWLVWVLAGALPFVVGYAGLLLARVTGLLGGITPGAVGPGAVPLTGRGTAVLIGVGVLIVLSFLILRPSFVRVAAGLAPEREPDSPAASAAAVALSVVGCLAALVIWIGNPLAAALVVVALHLWLWLAEPEVRARRWLTVPGLLLALIPPLAVLLYYYLLYGFTLGSMLWSGALMLAGGTLGLGPALYWSVICGCLFASVLLIARGGGAAARPATPEITVRGPIGYAGPGSLGGTESALPR